MKDLVTLLREIKDGVADPGGREIAVLALDLVAKQIRQSWATRSTENQEPWKPTVLPSFAGVLSRKHPSGRSWWNLLHHDENLGSKGFREAFYLKGKGQTYLHWPGEGKAFEEQGSHTPTNSFIAEKALKLLRSATITEKGFETDALPKYGMWQSDGTENPTGWGSPIPARSFWAIGDDVLDLVAGIMADKAAKAVARAA